jgi:hypothetical protein
MACGEDDGCLCYIDCLDGGGQIWECGMMCGGWNMAFGDLAGCQGQTCGQSCM